MVTKILGKVAITACAVVSIFSADDKIKSGSKRKAEEVLRIESLQDRGSSRIKTSSGRFERRPAISENITTDQIDYLRKNYQADKDNNFLQNAACNTRIKKIVLNRDLVLGMDNVFSHEIYKFSVTDQEQTGRCWLFAALNVLRIPAMKNLDENSDFELSHVYIQFWNKFEMCNSFLEKIIKLRAEDIESRNVRFTLFGGCMYDGGFWDYATNLIEKYGVVPKSVMPETVDSGSTALLNRLLSDKLHEYAFVIRDAYQSGWSVHQIRDAKYDMLSVIHRMLCAHLGEPPSEFKFRIKDNLTQGKSKSSKAKTEKKEKYGLTKTDSKMIQMTPVDFYKKYVNVNLKDFVVVIHSPLEHRPFYQSYEIDDDVPVCGSDHMFVYNLPMDEIKDLCRKQILDNTPVWFTCQMNKHIDYKSGIMDPDIYKYEYIHRTKPNLSKGEQLLMGTFSANHAMVFSGVDIDKNDQITKWKVQNSWGGDYGLNGHLIMTNNWFDAYVSEAIIDKKYLNENQKKMLKSKPVKIKMDDVLLPYHKDTGIFDEL